MIKCYHLYFRQEDQLVRMNEQRIGHGAQQIRMAIGIAKVRADGNNAYFREV